MVALTHGGTANDSPDTPTESRQVDVRQLAPGTELIVDTAHSKYRLVITDGATGCARLQGGRMFLEPTAVRIEGTRTEDHELMNGVLSVGRGFDFIVWNERGRTSPVQSIAIGAPDGMPHHPQTRQKNGDEQ